MCNKDAVIQAARLWQEQTVYIAQYQTVKNGSPVVLRMMKGREEYLYSEFIRIVEESCLSQSTLAATSA